jgi:hypothetical protein
MVRVLNFLRLFSFSYCPSFPSFSFSVVLSLMSNYSFHLCFRLFVLERALGFTSCSACAMHGIHLLSSTSDGNINVNVFSVVIGAFVVRFGIEGSKLLFNLVGNFCYSLRIRDSSGSFPSPFS